MVVCLLNVVAVVLLVACVAGCASSVGVGDPYFVGTESKANMYARQAQSKVLKIAVMPFKASTELIGSSVSDMAP